MIYDLYNLYVYGIMFNLLVVVLRCFSCLAIRILCKHGNLWVV